MIPGVEWQFGGLLAGQPPARAVAILAGCAVAGVALVIWLYRRTLRELPPAARAALTTLRAALVLAVLLCLANPSRVVVSKPAVPDRSTLAVVVDRSDSMTASDARGESRLRNAVRIWQRHVPAAGEVFAKTAWYGFSTGLEPAENFEAAGKATAPGAETHLYSALGEALATDPGGLVCLTDGLDTTDATAGELARAAQRAGVPLYFVAGTNRLRPGEMLNLRDVSVPTHVLRQTRFMAQVVIEVTTAQERDVPVELWAGSRRLAAETFRVRPGLNTFPWSVPVDAGEAGPLPLEFRLGAGAAQQLAGRTTQVIDRATVDILYYQGALQWGYRFLLSALRSDPSFRLTSIINPALGLRMSASTGDLAELRDLPVEAAELKKFQIVVLAHVFADQLTPRQQQALLEYAKGGGGVLFIAPDSAATASFTGTALERMLPVTFEPVRVEMPEETAKRRFREQMQNSGEDQAGEAVLDGLSETRRPARPLRPFALPDGVGRSKIAELFAAKDPASLPRFADYARVRRAKPGAQVLAVHPTDREADGRTPRVLLARQQFGAGFTAVLTTDLLWRWKMSLPHASRAPEKFWQQLFLSLAPARGDGLRLVKNAGSAAVGQPVNVRVEASADGVAPTVQVLPPGGVAREVELRSVPGETAAWQVSFAPETVGRWEVRASDEAGGATRVTLSVKAREETRETANLPADVEGLRQLAESTGGALIEDDPVFQPRTAVEDPVRKRSQPLWNQGWLLALLLGIYGTELLTRRWLKLL